MPSRERGHEVHGLVHNHEPGQPCGVAHTHGADLADLESVKKIVAEVRPDHVMHLAAIAFVAHGDVEQMYRTNVVGTRQLLEALAGASATPSSVLLASSANIYGNAREGVLDETVPPAPANDYGVSKLAMEYVAKLYASRLPITIVRPFNYTGRGQGANFLLPKIVAHARDATFRLSNSAIWTWLATFRTSAPWRRRTRSCLPNLPRLGKRYNICSGRAVSLRSVVEMVSELSRHPLQVTVNPAFVRANEVRIAVRICGQAGRCHRAA